MKTIALVYPSLLRGLRKVLKGKAFRFNFSSLIRK